MFFCLIVFFNKGETYSALPTNLSFLVFCRPPQTPILFSPRPGRSVELSFSEFLGAGVQRLVDLSWEEF